MTATCAFLAASAINVKFCRNGSVDGVCPPCGGAGATLKAGDCWRWEEDVAVEAMDVVCEEFILGESETRCRNDGKKAMVGLLDRGNDDTTITTDGVGVDEQRCVLRGGEE